MKLISGLSNQPLAHDVASKLGIPLTEVEISKFANGEKRVWVKDELGSDTVVLIQSFTQPVDERIIELALLSNAVLHLNAKNIIAVIPWFGYSPQDRSFRQGEPISIEAIAKILASVGISKILTIDIHSKKALEFFTLPVSEISARPLFVDYFKSQDLTNHIVISLDQGSRLRSEHIAKDLHLPIATFDKVRDRHTGAVTFEKLEGDVSGKIGLAFDDYVSTGSTLIGACDHLKKTGLKHFIACVTHAVFAGSNTTNKLESSSVDQIITTDTYPIPGNIKPKKLKLVSMAPYIAAKLRTLV